ncbi:tRNA (adenine(22)-N(1))-methyltransferase TrmK [Streptococcus sp. sy004]|uniref:tRNA (adenine(22)-N(1))-methyltransferase n=1 Tax=Streptococcus sp. sy004 TaxID=2600149 RepID=UPI0011B57D6C|nr:tRNA (adenine(22)-N(1))-methyltransferase TrmK [Streptococcus sp. sy004]TWT10392.1 tRNA (adenine-N(1))-methyltransferase [Streptococcus sp. sy004]
MENELSRRLQAVADFIPKNSRLLDVGSDHAYLPLDLVKKNKIAFAIAGEVVKGPYQSALTNVAQAGLTKAIDVRLANGLAAFELADHISVISICGMGGRLIADILEAGKEKLDQIERLVLQPNNREDELRSWLMANGFTLVAEQMIYENDKYYEIIVAEPGMAHLSAKDLRFGPYLLAECSDIFKAKWQNELKKLNHALNQVPEHRLEARQLLLEKIEQIKEVLL